MTDCAHSATHRTPYRTISQSGMVSAWLGARMRFGQLKRRELMVLLGGAATWPLAVQAQQPGRMRHIGVLMAAAAHDPEFRARIGVFQEGLALAGWTEGGNARIDIRWATTNADDIRRHAAELAAVAPDVILAASGTTTVAPLLQATRTVPIVF